MTSSLRGPAHPSHSPAAEAPPAELQETRPNGVSASFAERIRLLIQRVGSATEIARMCGFSEGVVRSWRDGNSDPSRARCVTLARTLGISLVWLVAGEGTIQADASVAPTEEQGISEVSGMSRERGAGAALAPLAAAARPGQPVDDRRLAAARQLLQSNLELSGLTLTAHEHQRLLSALYEIVGPGGTQVDAMALLAFHQQFAERVRHGTRPLA